MPRRASDPALQGLKLRLGPPLWRLLARTVRIRPPLAARPPRARPVIYACLHRDMIPAILYVRPCRPVLLVSHSPDGDILIRALTPDGFGFARGSTGRNGGQAFVRLLAALREGRSVGVAVDGPRGPFGTVHEGVVQLSRLSECPVVPLLVRPGRHARLRTWDRTIVPCPGGGALVREGPPLQVPPDAVDDAAREWSRRIAAALAREDEP